MARQVDGDVEIVEPAEPEQMVSNEPDPTAEEVGCALDAVGASAAAEEARIAVVQREIIATRAAIALAPIGVQGEAERKWLSAELPGWRMKR